MSLDHALGAIHTETITVGRSLTVPAVSPAFTGFADMPPVFATAFMVGFIEWACVEALRPHLEPGLKTVGTHVDVSHLGATPVGMEVTALVELIAAEGRRLRFKVTCFDSGGVIGEGFHERAVIEPRRFMEKLAQKALKTQAEAQAA